MKKILAMLLVSILCFCNVVQVMAETSNSTAIESQEAENESIVKNDTETITSPQEVSPSEEKENEQDTINLNGEQAEDNSEKQDATEQNSEQTEEKDEEKDTTEQIDVQTEEEISDSSEMNLRTSSSASEMPTGELLFITLASTANNSLDETFRWNANGEALSSNAIHLDNFSGENCHFKLYQAKDKNGNDLKGIYGIKHIKDGGIDYFVDIANKSKEAGATLHLWESSDSSINGNNKHRQFSFYYDHTDENGNDYYAIKNINSGLYLGYEKADEGESPKLKKNIVQTNKKILWIVSKAVVHKRGGEETGLIKNNSDLKDGDAAFVEIFKKGTLETINRIDDNEGSSGVFHFFEMGTSSKWRIKWHEKYSAYTIEAVRNDEKDVNSGCAMVWHYDAYNDKVLQQSYKLDDINNYTNQLWRFIKQSDGSYKIQNAKTGLYVAEKNDYLKFDYVGDDVSINVISNSEKSGNKETKKVNFNYADNWMRNIPDSALLSSVNIPGTHDTGTASIVQDGVPQFSLTSCQKYFYGEQLNVGSRSFDIRCSTDSDNETDVHNVKIVHGGDLWQCFNRDESKLMLGDILDDSIRFIEQYPTETIILMIKSDAGSHTGLARALGAYISEKDSKGNYIRKKYFCDSTQDIPTMGEARGKIILIRRYEIDTKVYDPENDGLTINDFGLSLPNWDDFNYSDHKQAIQINLTSSIPVYVQDAYSEYSSSKKDYILGTMQQTTEKRYISDTSWVYNYTSCAVGFPLGLTRDINPWLFKDEMHCIDNRWLGMVMLNFVDSPMAKLIYETNFQSGYQFAEDVEPPKEVKVTYGQTLKEAQISGMTGKGKWTFDDPDYRPHYVDYRDGKKLKITYTPESSKYHPITFEVKITEFTKKKVTATIENKEMTYGDEIPELTYTFDESQLVRYDNKTALQISMHVNNPQWSTSEHLMAKRHSIAASSASLDYDVQFTEVEKGFYAFLTVKPKTLAIKWSDTSGLYYTGYPAGVTAEITGVESNAWHEDDCKVYVVGGDQIEPSWQENDPANPTKYTAKAYLVGKDMFNYRLPESEKSVDYYIYRNEPCDNENNHVESDWIIDKKATSDSDGTMHKECTVCGNVLEISAISYLKTVQASNVTYNGKSQKPYIRVYDSAGKLINPSHYDINYGSGRKDVGTYKVSITFKGNSALYSGSKDVSFMIHPRGTLLSKVTGSRKSLTVKWKKLKLLSDKNSGYQIRYSISPRMTNGKTVSIKGNSPSSKTISNLKAKKKYYLQVRTYKTVKGKKYYSSWSKVKSVKTK